MIGFEHSALIIVDVQNDFLPGGALAVADGDAVIAPVNALVARFAHVVLTQDWHPPGHVSFASSHPGRAAHDRVALADGREQVLWPDHCLWDTRGAALADGLEVAKAELVIRKGYRADLDSYSAFVEADGRTRTGLAGYLRERGLIRVVVAGLATDYCAGWTARDAAQAGFETLIAIEATRGIYRDGSMERTLLEMRAANVRAATVADLLA